MFNINFLNKPGLQNDLKESIQWSLHRGNRTGRSAWQYIKNLAATKNLKISI